MTPDPTTKQQPAPNAKDARETDRRHGAVDHERQPGVPPETADDYDDIVDIEGAESFPASDPPSGW